MSVESAVSTGRPAARSVRRLAVAYRKAMAGFAALRQMEVWYQRTAVEDDFFGQFRSTVGKKVVKRAEKNVEKAQGKDHLKAFSKLTEIVDRDPRLITDPPSPPPAQVRSMCRAATERRRP